VKKLLKILIIPFLFVFVVLTYYIPIIFIGMAMIPSIINDAFENYGILQFLKKK